VCARWQRESPTPETEQLVKRALRGLRRAESRAGSATTSSRVPGGSGARRAEIAPRADAVRGIETQRERDPIAHGLVA
jgi:hypothetical protein